MSHKFHWLFWEVIKGIDKARAVDIFFMDFNKVFDNIRPVWKIRLQGEQKVYFSTDYWIDTWLSGRGQRGELFFGMESCDQWCPLRWVLGPLFIVIHINDLDDNVVNMVGKFVEDTKIGSAVKNVIYHYNKS